MLVKVINILLARTFTTDDLFARVGFLRDYYGAVLFSGTEDKRHEHIFPAELSEHTRTALTALIGEFTQAKLTAAQVYEALPQIESEVSRLPTVTLYLPVHFSPELVEGFGTWFRNNVQPNLLMEIRTDARVAGGCAVVWSSVYHDLSLRYYMRKHRKEIVTMFDRHTEHHAA